MRRSSRLPAPRPSNPIGMQARRPDTIPLAHQANTNRLAYGLRRSRAHSAVRRSTSCRFELLMNFVPMSISDRTTNPPGRVTPTSLWTAALRVGQRHHDAFGAGTVECCGFEGQLVGAPYDQLDRQPGGTAPRFRHHRRTQIKANRTTVRPTRPVNPEQLDDRRTATKPLKRSAFGLQVAEGEVVWGGVYNANRLKLHFEGALAGAARDGEDDAGGPVDGESQLTAVGGRGGSEVGGSTLVDLRLGAFSKCCGGPGQGCGEVDEGLGFGRCVAR
jgi:hypothetical protein